MIILPKRPCGHFYGLGLATMIVVALLSFLFNLSVTVTEHSTFTREPFAKTI